MGGLGYLDRRVGASDGIHSPMTAASTQLPGRAAEGEEPPTRKRHGIRFSHCWRQSKQKGRKQHIPYKGDASLVASVQHACFLSPYLARTRCCPRLGTAERQIVQQDHTYRLTLLLWPQMAEVLVNLMYRTWVLFVVLERFN